MALEAQIRLLLKQGTVPKAFPVSFMKAVSEFVVIKAGAGIRW